MTQQPHDYDPNETDPAPMQVHRGTDTPGNQGRPIPPAPGTIPAPGTTPAPAPAPEERHVTRAGMVWAAVATALAVMVLLIVFILQNQDYVQVRYFGLEGAVPLGIALVIAAVGGGILVAVAGAARIIQLRATAHRRRIQAKRVR
jgi:uncharacterized integral membrane protein